MTATFGLCSGWELSWLLHVCDIGFKIDWFHKIAYINNIQYSIFFFLSLKFRCIVQFFMVILWCMPYLQKWLWQYRTWHCSCKIFFCGCWVLDFLFLAHLWTGLLSTTNVCFMNICLMLCVYKYFSRQSLGAGNWNFHYKSWHLYLSYYHILFPMYIISCLIHCKTVFSIVKTYRTWWSGMSLCGQHNCDWDWYFLNGWVMPVKTMSFRFIPRH